MKKFCLLFSLLFLACRLNPFVIETAATLTTPRTIERNTLGVAEQWRVHNLAVWTDVYQPANFVLGPRELVAVDNRFGVIYGKVISWNTDDGSVKWEFDYNKRDVASLSQYQDKFYIASAGERLKAYSFSKGELVWESQQDLIDRTGQNLQLQNGILFNYVYENNMNIVEQFDPETGELLSIIKSSNIDNYTYMSLGEIELQGTTTDLFKTDRVTGKTLWTLPRKVSVDTQNLPLLSDDYLIVASEGRYFYKIQVIDFTTGQSLWQSHDKFVSNVVVKDGKIYALREDARLVVLDEQTGFELAYIQFLPKQTHIVNKTGGTYFESYWVGVDDQQQIFVYFGDSQEVIAFSQ